MQQQPAQNLRPRNRDRDYDVVIWGATGFVGELISEYYMEQYPEQRELRWAIAGRSQRKLDALLESLSAKYPSATPPDVLVGDSFDRASLEAIASRTEVICTTVGPYAKYGKELVAVCIEQGTDYCDLTGEPQFIREMIDAHHDAAVEAGVRIVHCCGYDSIPSDLGTLLLQDHAMREHQEAARSVKLFMISAKGGFSGGTVASMVNAAEEMIANPEIRKILGNPYSLNPAGERKGPRIPAQTVQYDEDIAGWTGPFLMEAINSRIVRRSNALAGYPYSEEFRYTEAMNFKDGAPGFMKALGVTVSMIGFFIAMGISPVRELLKRTVLPAPGEGPSRELIENGHFHTRLIGQLSDRRVQCDVRGYRDPGYGATATMIGEAAACLAQQGAQLDSPGGILTPASSMGMTLIDRLRRAGMDFEARDMS